MTPEIRPMTEVDIPSYHACVDTVAKEHRFLALLAAPSLAEARSFVTPHIQQKHPFFVAVAGAQVVGWCDITPREHEWFAHCGTLGMGVHPDFRRRGLVARLLGATLARAREMGLERVELQVFASNPAARQLYQRFGFTVEGTRRHARKSDGGYDDNILMALFLNASGI